MADVLATREGSEGNYKYYMNYLPDPTKYAGGTVSSDYVKLSYEMAKDGGYVKELGKDKRYPFIRMTSVVGGSSTTYYADYYWPAQSAVCAVIAGGNLNNGRNYGPRYFNCNNAPSNSNWNRRARLSLCVPINYCTPFRRPRGSRTRRTGRLATRQKYATSGGS